ncbi:MAG: hypothetical protein M1450_04435 [Patescibacteria group bacterium]|nr:hypothetical protein [Patescibacteria group bacterium]
MELEKRIKSIEDRNKKVEADKSWETSLTRKIFIIVFTYFFIGLVLTSMKIDRPWLNAIVPAIGFFMSTLTMPFLKSFWLKYFYNGNHN